MNSVEVASSRRATDNMKTPTEIERIVREVIHRLTSEQAVGIQASSGRSQESQKSRVLQVADQVITLSSIEGQLTGIQELVVPPKAVVTPSVRDELRNKNVELVRQGSACTTQAKRKLLVANLGTKDVSQVIDDLRCDVQMVQQASLEAAISDMTSQLTNSSLGVIIVTQPEFAVCLANRSSNVRAFVGHSVESVRRAKMFEGNLMALDAAMSSMAILLKSFLN